MNTHADNTQKNKNQSVSIASSQVQIGSESTFQFMDNRPEAIAHRKLQEMANNSPQAKQAIQMQEMANNFSIQNRNPIQKKKNNTGLPDNLKAGIENLSDYSMDNVTVHYNSSKPTQLNAHAYAQGTDIHLGSGQEQHLPHEAWHLVLQKQGRVKPTIQMKGNVNINDDGGLEKEADSTSAKALQFIVKRQETIAQRKSQETVNNFTQAQQIKVIQPVVQMRLLDWPNSGYDQTSAEQLGICKSGKIDLSQLILYPHITDTAFKALKAGQPPNITMYMADSDWTTVHEGTKLKIMLHAGKNILSLKSKGMYNFVNPLNAFEGIYNNAFSVGDDHILHVSSHPNDLGMGHRHVVFYDGKPGFDSDAIKTLMTLLRDKSLLL